MAVIQQAKQHKNKEAYEQWYRCKEHQANLREVLIIEAKRDLYEKLAQKQAELDMQN